MTNAVWRPQDPKSTRLFQFMHFAEAQCGQSFQDYKTLHHWSVTEPDKFWQTLCNFLPLKFNTPAKAVLSSGKSMLDAQWFDGATLNFAEQLLTRNDDHPALVAVNERGEREVYTFRALRHAVASCAKGLQDAGLQAGDRVAAVMPNIPMTIIAMLATTALGAIWSSCSPDFGAQAALDRLGQVDPKILFICNGHEYMGKTHEGFDKISQLAEAMPTLDKIIICPVIQSTGDYSRIKKTIKWDDFLIDTDTLEFKPFPFNHPLYILFSSGTTGKPKCIVHGAGGTLIQHLKELALHSNLSENDNLCFYTTCGWMMWNWMVSVLALGTTLTLYEGAPAYPDAGRLFDLIDKEQITVFGTSAKFISSVEKAGVQPIKEHRLASLKTILSTGSPLLPANYDFVYQQIKPDVQLSSISGGTDIISCFALGNPILPVYRGELQCLGLGMAVDVFNEDDESVKQERGELVCTKPFPSMPVSFWHDPDKTAYRHAYFERFPGIWAHGDFAEITQHQGLIIYGRSDATLNPGGVRIGTAEIYRQVEKIPQVVDSVVIGQDWDNDVRVVLFVKLQQGLILDEALIKTIQQTIRNHASPRHVPAKILQVSDIPRTISGKIVEIAVRQAVHGQIINNLQSMANPEALDEFKNRKELDV